MVGVSDKGKASSDYGQPASFFVNRITTRCFTIKFTSLNLSAGVFRGNLRSASLGYRRRPFNGEDGSSR
jgi:hypothetical protein